MRKPISQPAKTVPLFHLFNRDKAAAVSFEKDLLCLADKSGQTSETVRAGDIAEVQLKKLPLLNRLTIQTKQGESITINGLERSTSESLYARLQNRVDEILNDEATTSALAIGLEITAFKNSITALFTCPKYLRHSHTQEVKDAAGRLTRGLDSRRPARR